MHYTNWTRQCLYRSR